MADCTDKRCRICTANDQEALIEYFAERLWERRRESEFPPWAGASDYWQRRFREHAAAFVDAARG